MAKNKEKNPRHPHLTPEEVLALVAKVPNHLKNDPRFTVMTYINKMGEAIIQSGIKPGAIPSIDDWMCRGMHLMDTLVKSLAAGDPFPGSPPSMSNPDLHVSGVKIKFSKKKSTLRILVTGVENQYQGAKIARRALKEIAKNKTAQKINAPTISGLNIINGADLPEPLKQAILRSFKGKSHSTKPPGDIDHALKLNEEKEEEKPH